MKKLLLSLPFLLASICGYTQIMFERTYGGGRWDVGNCVIQTSDGGYAVLGNFDNNLTSGDDIYLIKTNAYGDTIWTKKYGGSDDDYGYQILQLSNGGYIISGSTKSLGNGATDALLIKTDALGNLVWLKTYGGVQNDLGGYFVQTDDGGYLMVGVTKSYGAGDYDAYLIRTNSFGDTLWTKTYGTIYQDWGGGIASTTDGGYVLVLDKATNMYGETDIALIKTNANGDFIWTKIFHGTENDAAGRVLQTSDNGFIVAGSTSSYGAGSYDFYLIKTNSFGDTLWTKTYGKPAWDICTDIIQTSDKGYILSGYMESQITGDYQACVIKIDSIGDTLWTKYYGNGSWTAFHSFSPTYDGGFIFTGYFALGEWDYDIYLVKTDSNFFVGTENEEHFINSIKVYPNPTFGLFHIQIPKQFGKTKTLEVYNCIGQLQFEQSDSFAEVDISSLTSGLYFIVLTNLDNQG